MNSMTSFLLSWMLFDNQLWVACKDREGGFPEGVRGLTCLLAVSPCPFALIKHLEHGRRQITASDTGVLVHFCLSAGPQGALPVFNRASGDMGAVTSGTPEAQAAALNRVALSLFDYLSPWARGPELWIGPHPAPLTPSPKPSNPLTSPST